MPPVIQTEEEKPKSKGKLKIKKLLKIKTPKKQGKLKFEDNATAEHPDISAIITDVKVYANNEEIGRKSPAKKDDESAYNSTNCTRKQQISLDDTANQPTKKDYKKHRKIKKAFRNFAKFKTKTPKKADENGEIPDANYSNEVSIKPVYSEEPSNKYSRKEDYDNPADAISGSLDADLDVNSVKKSISRKFKVKNPLKIKAHKENKKAKKQSVKEAESIQNQDASCGNNDTDGKNDTVSRNDNEVLHIIQGERSKGKVGNRKLAVLEMLNIKTSSENVSNKDNQNKAPSRGCDIQETGIEGPSYLRDYIKDYDDRVRKCENENQSNKKKPKIKFKIRKKKDNLPKNEASTGGNSGSFHSAKKNKDSQEKDNETLGIQDEILGAKAVPESKSKKGMLKKWQKIKSKKLFKLKYKNDKKETVETRCEIVAENTDDFHADNDHNKSENSATTWECDTEVYYQSEVQNEPAAAEPDVLGKRFSDFVKTRKRKNNKYLKCCCMRQEEVGDYYSPANEERNAGISTNLDEIPNEMYGKHQLAVFDASKAERRKVHLIDTASC